MSGGKCLMFALERIWGQTDRSSSYITGTELTVLQHLFTPTKPHSCLAGLRPRLFLPTPTPCPLPLLPQLSLLQPPVSPLTAPPCSHLHLPAVTLEPLCFTPTYPSGTKSRFPLAQLLAEQTSEGFCSSRNPHSRT